MSNDNKPNAANTPPSAPKVVAFESAAPRKRIYNKAGKQVVQFEDGYAEVEASERDVLDFLSSLPDVRRTKVREDEAGDDE